MLGRAGYEIARLAEIPWEDRKNVDGSAVIDGETLGAWDFFYVQKSVDHGPVDFPQGATLLAVTLR